VDRLEFEYLFASTPGVCLNSLRHALAETAKALSATLRHGGVTLDVNRLDDFGRSWLADLKSELDEEPGSESLAILIQEMFYQ